MSCVKVRTANISSSTLPSSAHINMQRAQKRGTDDEATPGSSPRARSRGGPSTKINAVVDALGNPLRFILTGGQVHDSKQAEALIDGFDFDKALADKGYDAMTQVRILVADNHEVARLGLRALLAVRSGWEVVGEVGDSEDAIRKVIELKPDVAILDCGLPLVGGLEAARARLPPQV